MISGKRFGPEIFRHFFLADIINLKTMIWAVVRFRHPLVFRVRLRIVAKTRSIGFAVLCSATIWMRVARQSGLAWLFGLDFQGPSDNRASICPVSRS